MAIPIAIPMAMFLMGLETMVWPACTSLTERSARAPGSVFHICSAVFAHEGSIARCKVQVAPLQSSELIKITDLLQAIFKVRAATNWEYEGSSDF